MCSAQIATVMAAARHGRDDVIDTRCAIRTAQLADTTITL
jgi:hypothetical protein